MRTHTEALKEIRDRLTYFCLRTDGKYDPPWVTELIGIIDESVTERHAVGNAAALREALKTTLNALKTLSKNHSVDLPEDVRALLGEVAFDVNTALAAPPRNCDFYDNKTDAETRFVEETGEDDRAQHYWQMFAIWLFAQSAKRKGE